MIDLTKPGGSKRGRTFVVWDAGQVDAQGNHRKLVVRLTEHGVRIRPYRTKNGEVLVPWGGAYRHQLISDAEAVRADRRVGRRVRRGMRL